MTNTANPVVLRALEDGLYSIAEGLRLCASRHTQLDLDPSEFGSGFRIVRSPIDGEQLLDIYLYDTLSGGAGYAELAGRYRSEILEDLLNLLEQCPAGCDRSCESCLRHYHNQHLRDRLDRHVGASLLRYALRGEVPPELNALDQAARMVPLRRMLELDGFHCESVTLVADTAVPLRVTKNGRHLSVGLQSGLVNSGWQGHSLNQLKEKGEAVLILNEFVLRRNLPDEHSLIRDKLA